MNEVRCAICEAYFPDSVMEVGPIGVLKCKPCHKDHPKAKSKSEVLAKSLNKAETLTEARVMVIVYEILAEAGLIRHECEKCGVPFFRRKPMQVKCEKCGGLEKKDDGKKEAK